MKIKIIDVNYNHNEDIISLEEYGFKVGDVIGASGEYKFGKLAIKIIRDNYYASIGSEIVLHEGEYEVIEE